MAGEKRRRESASSNDDAQSTGAHDDVYWKVQGEEFIEELLGDGSVKRTWVKDARKEFYAGYVERDLNTVPVKALWYRLPRITGYKLYFSLQTLAAQIERSRQATPSFFRKDGALKSREERYALAREWVKGGINHFCRMYDAKWSFLPRRPTPGAAFAECMMPNGHFWPGDPPRGPLLQNV